MKKALALPFALLLVLLATAAIAEAPWYNIDPNEEYISDFVIGGKGEKVVSVAAKDVIRVMYRVDVNEVPFSQLKRGPYPLSMTDAGTNKSVSSFWGGIECTPVKGKVKLKFANKGSKPLKVLVVRMVPPRPDSREGGPPR
ncbi:MAG TPA: hypothetical protein VIU29_10755 [Candidatus Deferrimicrobiaceae bacterium]